MKKLSLVLITLVLALSLMGLDTESWEVYDNTELSFNVIYPDDWSVIDEGGAFLAITKAMEPVPALIAIVGEELEEVISLEDTEHTFEASIGEIKEQFESLGMGELTIKRSESGTLAGYPAYYFDIRFTAMGFMDLTMDNVLVLADDHLLTLNLTCTTSAYNDLGEVFTTMLSHLSFSK